MYFTCFMVASLCTSVCMCFCVYVCVSYPQSFQKGDSFNMCNELMDKGAL